MTANTMTTWMHLCACCADHADTPMQWETATCKTCGQPCNCGGCIAED